MIERKVEQRLERFRQEDKALLITGARQVGKTFIIREFGKQAYQSFIEINFLEDKTAASLFENARDSRDLLLRLSAIADKPLIPGQTLIFFDEVVLEQQRLVFRVDNDVFQIGNVAHQDVCLRRVVFAIEIRRHAAFQIFCLADINDGTFGIMPQVYAC